MELLEEHRYIQVVQMQIKICHHHPQVLILLDVIQILPKINNILSIINHDQRIQVNFIIFIIKLSTNKNIKKDSLIIGWPNTTNQYNSTSGNNRVQYPSQQPQSQTQQQQQQSQQQTSQSASSTPSSGLANNQQWGSQQPNRTTPQPTLNAIAHAPPPWDHRYSNQPSPLYSAPGNHQVIYSIFII